jgi:hypothetical protein
LIIEFDLIAVIVEPVSESIDKAKGLEFKLHPPLAQMVVDLGLIEWLMKRIRQI